MTEDPAPRGNAGERAPDAPASSPRGEQEPPRTKQEPDPPQSTPPSGLPADGVDPLATPRPSCRADDDAALQPGSSMDPGSDSGRECRICLLTEDPEDLVRPCKCTGSVEWAHMKCLRAWHAENLSLKCEICGSVYNDGVVERLMDIMVAAQYNREQGAPLGQWGGAALGGPERMDPAVLAGRIRQLPEPVQQQLLLLLAARLGATPHGHGPSTEEQQRIEAVMQDVIAARREQNLPLPHLMTDDSIALRRQRYFRYYVSVICVVLIYTVVLLVYSKHVSDNHSKWPMLFLLIPMFFLLISCGLSMWRNCRRMDRDSAAGRGAQQHGVEAQTRHGNERNVVHVLMPQRGAALPGNSRMLVFSGPMHTGRGHPYLVQTGRNPGFGLPF